VAPNKLSPKPLHRNDWAKPSDDSPDSKDPSNGFRSRFELPEAGRHGKDLWRRWIDTALDWPYDIAEWEKSPLVSAPTYPTGPRSVVVLIAR